MTKEIQFILFNLPDNEGREHGVANKVLDILKKTGFDYMFAEHK